MTDRIMDRVSYTLDAYCYNLCSYQNLNSSQENHIFSRMCLREKRTNGQTDGRTEEWVLYINM